VKVLARIIVSVFALLAVGNLPNASGSAGRDALPSSAHGTIRNESFPAPVDLGIDTATSACVYAARAGSQGFSRSALTSAMTARLSPEGSSRMQRSSSTAAHAVALDPTVDRGPPAQPSR
jgi:hypothetical protein